MHRISTQSDPVDGAAIAHSIWQSISTSYVFSTLLRDTNAQCNADLTKKKKTGMNTQQRKKKNLFFSHLPFLLRTEHRNKRRGEKGKGEKEQVLMQSLREKQ